MSSKEELRESLKRFAPSTGVAGRNPCRGRLPKGRLTASMIAISRVALGIASAALALAPAHAEMTSEELAKLSQNPIGNLISVPFQSNTYLLISR